MLERVNECTVAGFGHRRFLPGGSASRLPLEPRAGPEPVEGALGRPAKEAARNVHRLTQRQFDVTRIDDNLGVLRFEPRKANSLERSPCSWCDENENDERAERHAQDQ
jgi:hypothetical protein